MRKHLYVYILTNHSRTLYVGLTNNLCRRLAEHKAGTSEFTGRYQIDTLVHYEVFANPREAIAREKQLKNWNRGKKIALIEIGKPNWDELGVE